MLIAASIFVGFIIVLFLILLALSPGKTLPIKDENGKVVASSISEKIWIDINGYKQGMFIKGKDKNNPVLLFMHGGTGMPEYYLAQKYPIRLEDYFIVCWWDRRGAGLSYSPDIPTATMTVENQVADTLEVTKYLTKRFGKDKIFVMAHSGGSFISIQAIAKAPELYYAYMGIGQMVYQLKSENIAYSYMLKQFKENGDTKMAQKLEKAPVTMTVPLPVSYMSLRDIAMHRLGIGTTHEMKSVITGIFLPSLLNREYTLGEKLNIWRGKSFCDRLLWDKIIATDLTLLVPGLQTPVYFFHGKYDYTVNYDQTKAYFEKLQAPLKGFYTFPQSAHSPMFEEPERFHQIIREDVLKGSFGLSDSK